ncbi:MAG: FAD-binding protein, partial [Acidobacteria bacterium]|nr:FAD-binding protein [Acidobacteriota bacterium]
MTVDAATLAEIQDAVRGHDSLVVRAGGTKSPAQAAGTTIGLSKLRGITEYSPAECVLTAWAGTPLRDIEQALRAHAQYLPFDPPLVDAGATIGGTVATGLSGSGRYRYGGVRDFLIGARVVDGEGTVIRSGGKVVKNAAGFLLHHALVGSAGRFGVIAEVTFKVFPLPEARATLKVTCGSAAAAASTARSIEATRFDCEALDFDTHGTLWVRIAGRSAAVRSRLMRLHDVVGGARIEDDNPEWAEAREFTWAQGRSIVKSVDGPHTATPARYICAGAASWIACDDCLGGPIG